MYIHLGNSLGKTPSCASANCAAVSVHPFDRQPKELQRVLIGSTRNPAAWFNKIDPKSRFALTSIFNRMCRYKLWCHASRILKIIPGEAPVKAAGRTIEVPGRTPSVYFLSPSGDALIKALMATGRFCMAHGTGASQHPGQTTTPRISDSDSLHISIGPGNQFDAHIDRYSPVTKHPGSSFCSNRPTPAALRHIGRELVPEIVRKKTGIPGVQLFPDFEPGSTVERSIPATGQKAEIPPPLVGIRWNF